MKFTCVSRAFALFTFTLFFVFKTGTAFAGVININDPSTNIHPKQPKLAPGIDSEQQPPIQPPHHYSNAKQCQCCAALENWPGTPSMIQACSDIGWGNVTNHSQIQEYCSQAARNGLNCGADAAQ